MFRGSMAVMYQRIKYMDGVYVNVNPTCPAYTERITYLYLLWSVRLREFRVLPRQVSRNL